MYKRIVDALTYIKEQGVSREAASDYLEFDSDESPDQLEIEAALAEVYGPSTTAKQKEDNND